jgi:hypothetical protein
VVLELIVQIVILITAIVGLYKAVTFGAGDGRPGVGGRSFRDHPFAALLEMASVMGMVLLMPALVLGMMWFSKTAMSLTRGSDDRPQIGTLSAGTEAAYALAAAASLRSYDDREEGTRNALTIALRNRDYGVAIEAARLLRNSQEQDEALKLIIHRIAPYGPSMPSKAGE